MQPIASSAEKDRKRQVDMHHAERMKIHWITRGIVYTANFENKGHGKMLRLTHTHAYHIQPIPTIYMHRSRFQHSKPSPGAFALEAPQTYTRGSRVHTQMMLFACSYLVHFALPYIAFIPLKEHR